MEFCFLTIDLGAIQIQAQLCTLLHISELEFLIYRDMACLKGLNMMIKLNDVTYIITGTISKEALDKYLLNVKRKTDRPSLTREKSREILDSLRATCSAPGFRRQLLLAPPAMKDSDPGWVQRDTRASSGSSQSCVQVTKGCILFREIKNNKNQSDFIITKHRNSKQCH